MLPEPRSGAPDRSGGPRDRGAADDLTVAPSQPRPGLLLLRVLGELDLQSAGRCARILHGAIDAAAAEHRLRGERAVVVCDVADVDFLGASGLSVLVDAEERARERGVELVVVVGEGPIRRLLGLTGLDRRLTLAERLADVVDDGVVRSPRP